MSTSIETAGDSVTAAEVVVVGAGPAGQKAAVQAAKAGRHVILIEEERLIGGACVRRGTIPSKTLRESAALWRNLRKLGAGIALALPEDLKIETLMERKEDVIAGHSRYMREQLERNGITVIHGRARFSSPHSLEVIAPRGARRVIDAQSVILATGSRPRSPEGIGVDHEIVFDSDSILSLTELPTSLAVLGGGVIACEYASIFAALGVDVTIIDTATRPLGFLDAELSASFVTAFADAGGRYIGERQPKRVSRDADLSLTIHDDAHAIARAERVLCCLGRVANVEHLALENAGLTVTPRGLVEVDSAGRTKVAHIWAAGDIIGAPALASTSMEQGRKAALSAIGMGDNTEGGGLVPSGVFTIPELAAVGLTEAAARSTHDNVVVGRARFQEIARGLISNQEHGMLKIVATEDGQLLGVHIVGDGACELVHVGMMAMLGGLSVRTFIDRPFNFPTLAEAYRVAAFDVLGKIRTPQIAR